ncbi:MAG: hypothetical protein ACREPN_05790 [Rudaea sp.]
MRQVILLLLGLAVGAIAAANIGAALRQRDAYPRGLMQVMQHDLGRLRDAARSSRCDAGAATTLQQLRGLSGQIESAVYANAAPEAAFVKYAQRLRTALPAAVDCKTLAAAIERTDSACDACHRQYR